MGNTAALRVLQTSRVPIPTQAPFPMPPHLSLTSLPVNSDLSYPDKAENATPPKNQKE